MSKFRLIVTVITLLGTVGLLSSCGGSGNGGTPPVTTPLDFTNGEAAVVVAGQADFASNTPAGGASGLNSPYSNVHVSDGKLFISDYGNNRIMVFDSIPTGNGASANYALGQPNLSTFTAGTSDIELSGAQSPVISDGKLFVADYNNNRIGIYNTVPIASPGTIDVVVGQEDKISLASACSATGLSSPESISVAGGKIVVADSDNHRVLIWHSIPTSDGTAADLVLGQQNMDSCDLNAGGIGPNTLNLPTGVWTDGNRLVVNDTDNSRVLIWNSFPTNNGQAADLVLGQDNFSGSLANRGTVAAANTVSRPYIGVYVLNDQLFVADTNNNRVLVWNSFPTSDGQTADQVLGQSNFTDTTEGITATTLSRPSGVYVSGTQLFITDLANNRVLIYYGGPSLTLYAADGATGNLANLYTLSPVTGAVTSMIGPIGFAVVGLAFDPLSGTLYGVTGGADPNFPGHLLTIDKTTGTGTIVGDLYSSYTYPVPDITFTSDGTLYGWGRRNSEKLVTIDLTSGLATVVGLSPLESFGAGLAASASDQLFFAANGDTNENLYTVDRFSGAETPIALFDGIDYLPINAMAFNYETLYGVRSLTGGGGGPSGTQTVELITIDTTTAAITPVGVSVNNLSAIAFGN